AIFPVRHPIALSFSFHLPFFSQLYFLFPDSPHPRFSQYFSSTMVRNSNSFAIVLTLVIAFSSISQGADLIRMRRDNIASVPTGNVSNPVNSTTVAPPAATTPVGPSADDYKAQALAYGTQIAAKNKTVVDLYEGILSDRYMMEVYEEEFCHSDEAQQKEIEMQMDVMEKHEKMLTKFWNAERKALKELKAKRMDAVRAYVSMSRASRTLVSGASTPTAPVTVTVTDTTTVVTTTTSNSTNSTTLVPSTITLPFEPVPSNALITGHPSQPPPAPSRRRLRL
ncbi:hypothetical protein T439DRAFT_374828, partial [Meredithblackwellia eburnea MCA 4105]